MKRTVRERVQMAFTGMSLSNCCEEIASKYINAPYDGNCLHARALYHVRGKNLPIPSTIQRKLIQHFMQKAMQRHPPDSTDISLGE